MRRKILVEPLAGYPGGMTPDVGSFEESVQRRPSRLPIQRHDSMNTRPSKKNDRKLNVPTSAKKIAERAI
jgi:hypothetical protein